MSGLTTFCLSRRAVVFDTERPTASVADPLGGHRECPSSKAEDGDVRDRYHDLGFATRKPTISSENIKIRLVAGTAARSRKGTEIIKFD